MAANKEVNTFPLDEPPTLPRRTYSGAPLKPRVIKAFAEQVDAERQVNYALDRLISLVAHFEIGVLRQY